ncbi:MAG: hypothetical protein LBS20_19565 [Prevotella sp.]|jgi:hypothetical protein|nr:hypothetical protein [Prevotella sp.]
MAKQKNTAEEELKDTTETTSVTGTNSEEKKEERAPVQKTTGQAINGNSPFITGILKAFPEYESLYIDSLGGTFSVNTAPNIRGKAILYKNPFYRP